MLREKETACLFFICREVSATQSMLPPSKSILSHLPLPYMMTDKRNFLPRRVFTFNVIRAAVLDVSMTYRLLAVA
jgi:hypothetical protein